MSDKLSAIAVSEPAFAPGKFVIFRFDPPDTEPFAWCGRSIGWRSALHTSSALFRYFPSEEAAYKELRKAVTMPLQEKNQCLEN